MSNKLIRSMMEPLVSKFQSIEDRLTNLEEMREILSAHKEMINKHKESTNAILKKKEITDAERLDFLETRNWNISTPYPDGQWNIFDGPRHNCTVDLYSDSLRGAIDAAMRDDHGD